MAFPLLRSVLNLPAVYSLFSSIVGGSKGRSLFVNTYIRPRAGDRVLDIGCGPGSLLPYLPGVFYIGFDSNFAYIETAKRRYAGVAEFRCLEVTRDAVGEGQFDIVIASAVLHHLDDRQSSELFQLAHTALRPAGRLITLDGCYVDGQSRFARFLLDRDRGRFVRNEGQYMKLARTAFQDIKVSIRHDLSRPVPYTHIILECIK
jgi:SAM-dependent methyltransferase